MHRRLFFAGLAATGGLLTTAFLQVAVAAADTADAVSATGADAFTLGGYTFDPFTIPSGLAPVEGFAPVLQLTGAPPLLLLGGGGPIFGGSLAPQDFEVFDPSSHADLGSVTTSETVTNLLGLNNAEFTVTGVALPASDGSTAGLPATGSVYDVFNFGNGYENVYTAIPGASGGADTVTDTFVTPYGNTNLDSLFGGIDAAAPLAPGDAFTGLEVGNISGAADAFSIGGFTLDPTLAAGGEGFDPVASLGSAPPLLNLGGGNLYGTYFAPQGFDVYSGSGSAATDVGTINTGENVTNLLGLTNTELIVTSATAVAGGSAADLADLPTKGSVYDAFNFGNGYENVYTAIPGTSGGADTVTDTVVTPYGNINLDSLFGGIDAAAPLAPGDAFTGLELGNISGAPDAFSIGDYTFDPTNAAGGEGFQPVSSLIGAPPLLNIGGGTPALFGGSPATLAPQDFNVYDGTGSGATEVGNITSSEDVTNLLGLTNTEFTVTAATASGDASASATLPAVGSVYDVFNLGGGIENIYTAIPGTDGAAGTVTDTLVTPWGDLNLDSLFGSIDATLPLDPGDAFTAGLDAASGAATAVDPLAFLGF